MALLPLAAAPGLAVLAVLLIVAGAPLSPWLGSLSAAVQRAVPPTAVAEAFTWSFCAITVGIAAGSAVGGALIQAGGPRASFLAAGGLCVAGAAGIIRIARAGDLLA
jgi:predicted MFS family arabinose efflux permease